MTGRRRSPDRRRPARGFTLIEIMFSLAVITIASAIAIPQLLTGVDRARGIAGARYLAQQCSVARFRAVGQGRSIALQFTAIEGEYRAQMFADGNGNGVRATDIANGVDVPLAPPEALAAKFPGVRIAVDPALGPDPVSLSGTNLLSFTPHGTATAGTVYVMARDGTQLAVRVLGVTGRTRVLRYYPSIGIWDRP